jgi:hypothetical protein
MSFTPWLAFIVQHCLDIMERGPSSASFTLNSQRLGWPEKTIEAAGHGGWLWWARCAEHKTGRRSPVERRQLPQPEGNPPIEAAVDTVRSSSRHIRQFLKRVVDRAEPEFYETATSLKPVRNLTNWRTSAKFDARPRDTRTVLGTFPVASWMIR